MEKNNRLNIACMVHNAYFFYAKKFAREQGYDLDTFGGSPFYFYHDADLDANSYDMLVLFSGNFYSEMEEDNLNKAADLICEKSGKPITSAYLYCIPEDERKDANTDGVTLRKITEDGIIERKTLVDANYDVLDLMYDAVEFHNGKTLPVAMKVLKDNE